MANLASAVTTQLGQYLHHSLTHLHFQQLNTSLSHVFGGHTSGGGQHSGHGSNTNTPVLSVQHTGAVSPSYLFRPSVSAMSNIIPHTPSQFSQSNPTAPTPVFRPPLVMISTAAGRRLRLASPGTVSISPLTQNNIRAIGVYDMGSMLRACAMTGDTITMKGKPRHILTYRALDISTNQWYNTPLP